VSRQLERLKPREEVSDLAEGDPALRLLHRKEMPLLCLVFVFISTAYIKKFPSYLLFYYILVSMAIFCYINTDNCLIDMSSRKKLIRLIEALEQFQKYGSHGSILTLGTPP
jgi:hypothetical protein